MTRRELRDNIFKILFKAEFNEPKEMEAQLNYSLADIQNLSEKDAEYISSKVLSILDKLSEIDSVLEGISDGWKFDRIGKAELAILRLAIYEMKYDDDIPFKVAINEAIELSKKYCNPETGGFINGLLAKVEE